MYVYIRDTWNAYLANYLREVLLPKVILKSNCGLEKWLSN